MALDLNDKSGNGNTLTNSGGVEVTTNLPFAGSSEAVDIERSTPAWLSAGDSTSLSFTGDWTIELWVKLEQLPSTAGGNFAMVSKFTTVGNQRSFEVDITTADKIRIIYSGDGISATVIPTTNAVFTAGDVGAWVHIAASCSVSAKTGTVYKDGTAQAMDAATGTQTAVFDSTSPCYIGTREAGANLFDGIVDDVRIWNDIRSEAEIDANMSVELTGGEANLVAYWPFEALTVIRGISMTTNTKFFGS